MEPIAVSVTGVPPLGAGPAACRPNGAHRLSLHHAGGRVGAVGGSQSAPLPGSKHTMFDPPHSAAPLLLH